MSGRIASPGVSCRFDAARACACRALFVLFAALLAVALVDVPSGKAEEYRLGPQDKIRIKAYEWRASRDEIIEWKALNDEFVIGADGTLSIPFAGVLTAENLTPAELAKAIEDRLQAGMELGRAPDTSVEVVRFRPFYIVGHVDRPGEYPYRPSLTVLQALSVAGGLRRLAEQNLARLGREVIATKGDLSVISSQASSLLARKARVQAELNQSDSISFPTELTREQDNPATTLIMQQEQLIFDARREAFETQMRALNQLKDHLNKEIISLDAQVATEDKQIQLVKKELQGVMTLMEKGLSVTPRQLSLERTLAQIEGDRLRVGAALLRARQEISKADIAIIELQNKRANDATTTLRETQTKLDELARRFSTAEQLLYESEVVAPRSLSQRSRNRKSDPVYTIVRHAGDRTVELSATESTKVEPGDTIKVEVPALLDQNPFADDLVDSAAPEKSAATTRQLATP